MSVQWMQDEFKDKCATFLCQCQEQYFRGNVVVTCCQGALCPALFTLCFLASSPLTFRRDLAILKMNAKLKMIYSISL
jgi:hypothetical protein